MVAPTTGAAQSNEPFPNDQQPIADQYGLPPLDHQTAHHAGGAGQSGGGGASGTGSRSGTSASDASARPSSAASGGDTGVDGELVVRGAGKRPLGIDGGAGAPPADATGVSQGFDIVVLVLVALPAAALAAVATVNTLRRRRA